MKQLSRWSAALLLAACSTSVLAWDDMGHMLVAAVAYDRLKATPAVLARVDTLLKLNPKYASWTAGLPVAQRSQTAFLMAARWPDAIKGDTSYVNDGANNGETPVEPVASQNIGYKDKNRHKYWHYKDIGFSTDGSAVEPAKVPNAQTQIERFRATLAYKPATQDLKSYDLSWLLHLVGDVHQPLHATSRFTADVPHGDIGGNTVVVSCAAVMAATTAAVVVAGESETAAEAPVTTAAPQVSAPAPAASLACAAKLHAFWDDALGSEHDIATAITRAATLPVAPAAQAQVVDVNVWLQESLALARSDVYATPVGASGRGPYVLDAAYRANAATQAAQRVALAGARLARLIQTALK